jgi:hypothetical protein
VRIATVIGKRPIKYASFKESLLMSRVHAYRMAVCWIVILAAAATSRAQMRITEYMYDAHGDHGEFVEFTNMGMSPIDMTGWSFDDNSGSPGSFSLSAFGVVPPGASVVVTDEVAEEFREDWGLSALVGIIGDLDQGLGRNDTINLYDASDALVDALSYGDQDFAGTIRTQEISGNPVSLAALGADDASLWALSVDGDEFGSHFSISEDLGNPGYYAYAVPEPSTATLAAIAVLGLAMIRRRRRA